MKVKEFLFLCDNNQYTKEAIEKFNQAITLISSDLTGKKRISGDSFFEHNLRVANILAENSSAIEVVLAGLLHGHLNEDTKNKIKDLFGSEVFSLISCFLMTAS